MFLFSRLMSNDVMAKLNMKGKRGKVGLEDSHLYAVIKGISTEQFTPMFMYQTNGKNILFRT